MGEQAKDVDLGADLWRAKTDARGTSSVRPAVAVHQSSRSHAPACLPRVYVDTFSPMSCFLSFLRLRILMATLAPVGSCVATASQQHECTTQEQADEGE